MNIELTGDLEKDLLKLDSVNNYDEIINLLTDRNNIEYKFDLLIEYTKNSPGFSRKMEDWILLEESEDDRYMYLERLLQADPSLASYIVSFAPYGRLADLIFSRGGYDQKSLNKGLKYALDEHHLNFDLEIIERLIREGADINSVHDSFQLALYRGSKDVINYLLENGYDLDTLHEYNDYVIVKNLQDNSDEERILYLLDLDIPESYIGIERFPKKYQDYLLDKMTVETASRDNNLGAVRLLIERQK